MRVYTKVVINIKTLKTIEEVHRAYEGPVSLCGGGGMSGKVELPKKIDEVFGYMMYRDSSSMVLGDTMPNDVIAARTNNPFTDITSLDPSSELAAIDTEIGLYNTLIGALAETTDWAALMAQAVTTIGTSFVTVTPDAPADIATSWLDPTAGTATTNIKGEWLDPSPATEGEIAADVNAFGAVADDRIEADVLPRFQRGMQNINAVMSSAFVIGGAIIERAANRDVAKYQGQLRVAAFTQADEIKARGKLEESGKIADAEIQDIALAAQGKLGESNRIADAHIQDDQITTAQAEQKNKMYMLSVAQMLQYFMRRVDGELQVSGLIMEANKLRLIAEKEEAEEQMMLDESEGLWNFVIWQHAANMLAAPSGGAMVPGRKMSKGQSAMSGAMAGGAAGAQTGTWQGAAIGAGIGAMAGYYYG